MVRVAFFGSAARPKLVSAAWAWSCCACLSCCASCANAGKASSAPDARTANSLCMALPDAMGTPLGVRTWRASAPRRISVSERAGRSVEPGRQLGERREPRPGAHRALERRRGQHDDRAGDRRRAAFEAVRSGGLALPIVAVVRVVVALLERGVLAGAH